MDPRSERWLWCVTERRTCPTGRQWASRTLTAPRAWARKPRRRTSTRGVVRRLGGMFAALIDWFCRATGTSARANFRDYRDTELRFTVHDSSDYYNIKLSVFSEDKKTELIGEAFVDLTAVIIPGGGKNDVWQGLTCKGKYAGEIRLEFTYYDSRPKPDRPRRASITATEDGTVIMQKPKVKRRPLPGAAASIESFPTPARVRNGPRELSGPPRANSMPPDLPVQLQPGFNASPTQFNTPPGNHQQDPYSQFDELHDEGQFSQPEFLPQLPPTPRRQVPQGPSPVMAQAHGHHRGQSLGMLPHANSAPVVPTMDMGNGSDFGLHTDAPEPLPDLNYQHRQLRSRRSDVPPGWENPYDDQYNDPYQGHEYQHEEEHQGPPPPPMHSHSAPVLPHHTPRQSPHQSPVDSRYNGLSTPPSSRQQYIQNASPLQSIEREYTSPQHTPPPGRGMRGRSNEEYVTSPPHSRSYDNTPNGMYSPTSRSPVSRAMPSRQSMADIYHTTPPPRPHPLSKEVPRARSRSPMPPYAGMPRALSPAPPRALSPAPPRALSPAPPRALSPAPPHSTAPYSERQARGTYGIQFPVRAFESSEGSPLGTTRPHTSAGHTPQRPLPTRRSVSPRDSPTDTPGGGAPFSPDSYDQVRSDHGGAPPRDGIGGPIVGWDGREIDPSDHLPVDSWAPEPEKKTPNKTYGLGRDRDFGPRSQTGSPGTRLSNDTIINFRRKSTAVATSPVHSIPEQQPASPARNRMYKPSPTSSPHRSAEPLRERPNFNSTPPGSVASIPDPYAQEYSRGFYEGSPGMSGSEVSRYERKPASNNYYEDGALSREIAGIDLGAHTGSTRRMPTVSNGSPSGWQGVRSHRDRSFY
jgi:hypothetical protein